MATVNPTATTTLLHTITVTAAAAATTTAGPSPQGGILEGILPNTYLPSNPIQLFIIQVPNYLSPYLPNISTYHVCKYISTFTHHHHHHLGWHYYHTMSHTSLPIVLLRTTSRHSRGHRWHHFGSFSLLSHSRFPRGYLPNCLLARFKQCC